jgi:transcription termination factor NusB
MRRKNMFERFGEFDSAEEINLSAAGLKEEGDLDSLKALAAENGLDEYDAEDYMDGAIEELCNPLMAAMGKLDVECEELKPVEIMEDWVAYIRKLAGESEAVCRAIRRKNKSLKGCIAALLEWSFKHQTNVDQEIIKTAKISAGKVTLGIPGMGTAKKIIDEYYGGRA